MMTIDKRRLEINKLIQEIRRDAVKKNKKIETIDPIIRKGRNLYPLMSREELLDYCRTALRVILSEDETQSQQTTLFAHI
ncbi:hypothetical protein GF319_03410 [Candidatus Bathyarchaeota archaeon]|jgi:hypothetical protein|nr:hypothetical protein [Candidatus Bathyarchaeota archaeon]